MNPVNATALFVSAARSVLQCDPRDPRALAEVCRLLPFFRQSLSCLVCGNLLADPIAPVDSSCQHYVCLGCKGQRMQLRPSCSWCKDYSRFEQNRQLSLLVLCYRRLCTYVAQSPLAAHIAEAAADSPDLQAVLSEGLEGLEGLEEWAEEEQRDPTQEEAPSLQQAPDDPTLGVNGLHDCNGLPTAVTMDTGGGAGLCDIMDDLRPGAGPLLLSVEEVLRTLDPPSINGQTLHQSEPMSQTSPASCPQLYIQSENSPAPCPQLIIQSENSPAPCPQLIIQSENSSAPCPQLIVQSENSSAPCPPFIVKSENSPAPCPQLIVQSENSAVLAPFRCHRKRSRSESDSEKLTPVSLSALRGSPLSPAPKQEPHLASICPALTLPNGGAPKVGKTLLLPNKALKKTLEHHSAPKKACAKVRQQGAPKPRPQPRPPPHTHPLSHPPSPSKPSYKKPPEKRGCKCGRATQNPSVLTCRGQRCPCYSNRKACLDCICRGCQNSFMANGEKKLEAFAVPEKALEQTRLTLGINLSSITALRNPATTAPGNTLIAAATGSPVTASFLSPGAGHDARAFDDSLELRFDC